jgi:N-methylhydantoinase B
MIIRAHITYSRLAAIVRELSETVARTARSRGLADGGRFAVAALTGEAKVAAQQQFDPSHSYLIRESVAGLLDYFAFDLADGDVVVVGDPYRGGSTPQTLTFAAPVLHEGELVLFPAVRAEMADLAGSYPGALHPTATETWQESIRVTPIKLYRHGVLQRDILRFLLRNSRAEALVRSDIEAIVSSLRAAGAGLSRLLAERGRATVEEAIAAAIAHGGRLTRSALARWQGLDGTVSATIDRSPGPPIEVRLRLRVDEGRLLADFDGTAGQVEGPYNMTLAHARGYVLVAAAASLLDATTLNDGVLESVAATAPAGSLLAPTLPSATGLSDLVTGHAVGALVREALFGADDPGVRRLDGPAPSLVLFAPIGASEENPPYALDPGFTVSAQGWGPPVFSGRRRLPSAEILETRDNIELVSREFMDDGGIGAVLRNHRGRLQATAFVPRSADGADGAITLEHESRTTELDRAAGIAIPDGATLRFRYPSLAGRGS